MADVQTILELATEGGGLTIDGVKKNGQWMFRLVTDDSTPTLLDDDAVHEEHGWVKSLPEALVQIRWAWNCFYPLKVHAEFATEILELKLAKDMSGSKNPHVTHKWDRLFGGMRNGNGMD